MSVKSHVMITGSHPPLKKKKEKKRGKIKNKNIDNDNDFSHIILY